MKLFLTLFFLSIICSLALRKASQRSTTLLMLLISAGVVFGYFFLNQI
jgi:hypothetical protein